MTNGGQNLADALDKLDEVMPPRSSLVLELKISDEVLGGVPAVLDGLGVLTHERLEVAERLMERFGVEVEVQSRQILEDAPDTSSKRRKNAAKRRQPSNIGPVLHGLSPLAELGGHLVVECGQSLHLRSQPVADDDGLLVDALGQPVDEAGKLIDCRDKMVGQVLPPEI